MNGEKFTASEVLKQIFSFEYKTDSSVTHEHWFKVKLIDINEENTELLKFEEVKDYLSFTSPVPYKNTFSFSTEIYRHAKEIGYKIDEYNIKLNGEDVFKNTLHILKQARVMTKSLLLNLRIFTMTMEILQCGFGLDYQGLKLLSLKTVKCEECGLEKKIFR